MNRYAYQTGHTLYKNTFDGKRNTHPIQPKSIYKNFKAQLETDRRTKTGHDRAVVAVARLFRGTIVTGEPSAVTWCEPGLTAFLFE